MTFTELISVEHYIIHQISGVNLNAGKVADPKAGYGMQWVYQSGDELPRGVNEVLVENELKAAFTLVPTLKRGNADLRSVRVPTETVGTRI